MASEAAAAEPAAPPRLRRTASPVLTYLGVILIPPFLHYMSVVQNQTVGTFLVCSALLAFRFTRLYGADGTHETPVIGDRAVILVFALIGVHLAIASTFLPIALPRAVGSLLILGLMLLGAGAVARMLFLVPAHSLHRALRVCFLFLCAMAILAILGFKVPNPPDWRRPVFPFSEPSAFALAFVPLLMYVALTSRGTRRAGFLLLAFLCVALIQNLTILVGFALVALATIRWKVLLVGTLLGAAFAAQADLTYYATRLDFSGDNNNLSSLIYLQGWQMVGESWERSNGFGIGFQQLGVFGTDVPAAHIIRAMREGEDSNILDGGFVFAKLGSDFGLFALIVVGVYLWFACRSLATLRKMSRGRRSLSPLTVLAHCTILSYFIELFVRSAGYFTPATFLLVMSFGVLALERRRQASEAPAAASADTTERGSK